MGSFGGDQEEYDSIYDYDVEDSRVYEDLSEYDIEDEIEQLRGTIGRGDCLYCGSIDAMIYAGNICFICTECGRSIHEDLYYRWLAGYDIE